MSGYAMINMVAYIGQSFPNEAARRQRRVWVFCGIQNVESCQGVICGKSSAERSVHSTAENPHFHGSQNNRFPHIVQQMCNRCIATSGVPRSLPSIFFVVRLPKNRVLFLQFWLTSKSPGVLSFHWSIWLASVCIIGATVAQMIARIKHV